MSRRSILPPGSISPLALDFKEVVLLGHSYGAKKVAYYQVQQQDPRLSGLVAASSGVGMRSLDPKLAAQAQELVAQGRGQELLPWGSFPFLLGVMSAQTYLAVAPDLHGMQKPEGEIAKIHCPLLVCCGTKEGDDDRVRGCGPRSRDDPP